MNIPPFIDPEGSKVTVIVTDITSVSTKVKFTYDEFKIDFAPIAFAEVGSHVVEVKL